MDTRKHVAIALLGAAVAAAGPVAAADRDESAGTTSRSAPAKADAASTKTGPGAQRTGQTAGGPMMMQGVIDRVEQAGYRDVREVERKDGGRWEVYATDQQGQRVELYVDGRTGSIRRDDRD
jgi:hypothetical protein